MFRVSNSYVGANSMPHSSATATASASRPRTTSYNVTVVLSCNKSNDRRTIEIPAGKTIQIGRSSRSGYKGLYPAPNNALFDCAVVSRDHAELSMTSPWQDTRPRVTITDKGSLHGTTVNGRKLANGKPFELHSNDLIELGEKITRGNDAHEGVSLTFTRLDSDSSYHPRSPSPTMNRGYQVPDSPDHDASDYDSDGDLESLYYYGNEESSAKTTPEQPKYKFGTQESPINLEGAAGPSIVDLSQDDDNHDELIVMSAASNQNDESLVIPETYDEDAEPLVLESAPAMAVIEPVIFDDKASDNQSIPDSDGDEDDVESVRLHNTGLCQILHEQDDIASEIAEDGMDGGHEVAESEEEDIEYGYNSVDDADEQSDSAVSDPDDYESEPESDVDESSELYSSARLQHDPPAPQDTEQPQQQQPPPPKTSDIHSVLLNDQPKPKPQYDPVRGSQLAAEDQSIAAASIANVAPQHTSTYTYGYSGFGPACEIPATDFPDSSRWDIPPATMPFSGSFGGSFGSYPYFTAPAYGAPPPFGAPTTSPPMFAGCPPPPADTSATVGGPRNTPLYDGSEIFNGLGLPIGHTSTPTASLPLAETSCTKPAGKLAIRDIVDEEPPAIPEVVDDVSSMIDEAKKMVAAANSGPASIPSPTNTKRKADEIETLATAESQQHVIKKSKQQATGKDAFVSRPTGSVRPRSTLRRAAKTAAQYATAAAFGGAATIAFLSSPYAQSLIDFLG